MTAQFNDTVHFKGNSYALAGISGGGLFEPAEHGLEPYSTCTACWAGYLCEYAVRDNTLVLKQLSINLKEPLPVLFGVSPVPDDTEYELFSSIYKNVNHKLPFSGGLLLADDFIEELYVHMGFHPAWKYRVVHELIFHEGDLIEHHDRSDQMREVREQAAAADEPGNTSRKKDMLDWIRKSFSRRYDE